MVIKHNLNIYATAIIFIVPFPLRMEYNNGDLRTVKLENKKGKRLLLNSTKNGGIIEMRFNLKIGFKITGCLEMQRL